MLDKPYVRVIISTALAVFLYTIKTRATVKTYGHRLATMQMAMRRHMLFGNISASPYLKLEESRTECDK